MKTEERDILYLQVQHGVHDVWGQAEMWVC